LRYLGGEYFDITAIDGRSSLPRFAARPVLLDALAAFGGGTRAVAVVGT